MLCAVDEELPPIKHGNAITDRRSTFQPHLAPVVTPRQVQNMNDMLLFFTLPHNTANNDMKKNL